MLREESGVGFVMYWSLKLTTGSGRGQELQSTAGESHFRQEVQGVFYSLLAHSENGEVQ